MTGLRHACCSGGVVPAIRGFEEDAGERGPEKGVGSTGGRRGTIVDGTGRELG
jgi:hypothetical protein